MQKEKIPMSIQARMAALVCAAFLAACVETTARAASMSSTATLPLTATNFNTDGTGQSPLVFQKFNTQNGTLQLDAVDLSFSAQIQNKFGMTFTTPATITASVGAGNPSGTGPVITLYQPNGKTPLLSAASTNSAALTRTVTYGHNPGEKLPQAFGSDQPVGSKFYLDPATTKASNSLHLTAPQDLALFTGTGNLSLPVAAQAFSKFTTSSGNGTAWVTTLGSASATVTYEYHARTPAPEVVPEPATVILWSIGGIAIAAAARTRRRAS
jgi:hypothetical protein